MAVAGVVEGDDREEWRGEGTKNVRECAIISLFRINIY